MKRTTLVLLASALIFAGCQSKEKKAEGLIREELSKTLYDYDSYQPIETTVKEAKASIYNDSTCWRRGAVLAYGMDQTSEYIDQIDKAREHMDIWGKPTYYSSSYSDQQYYKYKEEADELLEKAKIAARTCKSIAMELKETASKLDTTQVIGWEVYHSFRCKTKGGNSTIGDYRYIIDKGFKKILLREDLDDEDDKHLREVLKTIQTDYWDDWDI